ncbi:MAG: carboxylesterase/lipase family protein, partial [bacterium]|nr:carboxylesterase/lipase family protein [bacterium]
GFTGDLSSIYDGGALARRGDVVVVSINYRLGVLGFSHLGLLGFEGLEGATNVGIRDQIAALEWVRDNIERFGGDPGNVGVFGQSAGGMSVGTLLGTPRARPLFHRAICQSGAADHVIDRDEATDVAQIFLQELGLPRPTPASLAKIPLGQILAAQRAVLTRASNLRNLMVLLPAVDGDLIPRQPLEALRAGEAADIPIVTGSTLDEWRLFRVMDQGLGRFRQADLEDRFREVLPSLPHAPRVEAAARQFREALGDRSVAAHPANVWSAFQSARIFHHPSNRLAEAQHAGGGIAYTYLFTWRAPVLRRAIGACHAIEIPFVFGSTSHPIARPLTGLSPRAGKLSRRLQHAWIGFVRHGSPGHERLPRWPTYDPERRSTLIFGRDCELSEQPLESERELLERWLGDHPLRGDPARYGQHNSSHMRAYSWLGSIQTSSA